MDGIILIDKAKGVKSFNVVRKIRNIIKIKRVGHTGTLDPNADGLLIICIGKATKLSSVFLNMDKEYIATIFLGLKTDSGDITGKSIFICDKIIPEIGQISKIIQQFDGEIEQIPPMFSAIHFKGKRLYELARRGEVVERHPRTVKIHSIEILDFLYPRIKIKVKCSKGTYIRTLCSDIGDSLNCGGCLESLTRVRIGDFHIRDSLSWMELTNIHEKEYLLKRLISIDSIQEILSGVNVNN